MSEAKTRDQYANIQVKKSSEETYYSGTLCGPREVIEEIKSNIEKDCIVNCYPVGSSMKLIIRESDFVCAKMILLEEVLKHGFTLLSNIDGIPLYLHRSIPL